MGWYLRNQLKFHWSVLLWLSKAVACWKCYDLTVDASNQFSSFKSTLSLNGMISDQALHWKSVDLPYIQCIPGPVKPWALYATMVELMSALKI